MSAKSSSRLEMLEVGHGFLDCILFVFAVLYGDGDGDEGEKKKLVSLSTGWFEKGRRCFKQVEIKGNGKTTVALVVDECDTQNGCDEESAYQPPCPLPNIVSASKAVWTALGVDDGSSCSSDPRFGWMDITWSDIIDDVHEDQAASLHLSAASDLEDCKDGSKITWVRSKNAHDLIK